MAESEEELKSLLMKVKEESEKADLKLNMKKTRIVTSWQTEGEKVIAVTDFLFLGSKITEDDDCSHEIKRRLLFGRKAMTNLDSVLKSRDSILPQKIYIVRLWSSQWLHTLGERWTVKKAEHQRIDALNCGGEDS